MEQKDITMKLVHNHDLFIATTEILGIGWTLVAWFSGANWIWVLLTVLFNLFSVYLILSKYKNISWRDIFKANQMEAA